MRVLHKLRLFLLRLFGKNERYYINGAQSLPPPLDADEEDRLVCMINDPEARQVLVEHNLRLVAFIAKRFENTGANIEELISIGTLGLMKAVSTFNKDKNIKLATYASRCIENEILMFLRKSSSQRRDISIDEPLSVDYDGNELLLSDVLGSDADSVIKKMEEDEESTLVRGAVEELSERERQIIEMRFGLKSGKELTQKEVADELGISQSYISRLEKRIISRLRRDMQKMLQIHL